MEKLRHYLLCTKFTIKCLSDHRSLTFLKNGKEVGGRIARWALSLGEYDYEIEYIKGKDNTLADVLSRMVATEACRDLPVKVHDPLGPAEMQAPWRVCTREFMPPS